MNELLGFVRLDHDSECLLRSLVTVKSFKRGDVVLRERPLASCGVDENLDRFTAYLKLAQNRQEELVQIFSDLETMQRGMSIESVDLADFQELFDFAEVKGVSLSLREIARVMCRWELARPISRTHLYKKISRLQHSCAATFEYRHDIGNDMGIVVSRMEVAPKTKIGIWLLDDVHTWWKGADVRSESLRTSGLLNQECACDRCLGVDVCRAFKCPDCAFGEVMREGRRMRWTCAYCSFDASDCAAQGFVDVEQGLISEIGDVGDVNEKDLASWVDTVCTRIGRRHWLYAYLHKEIYERHMRRHSREPNFHAVCASLAFMEWLGSRNVGVPPEVLLAELRDLALGALDFLLQQSLGVRDLRVAFLRAMAIVQKLFENMDEALLTTFQPYLCRAQDIGLKCGFCEARLSEKQRSEDDEASTRGDSTGEFEDEADCGPRACSICQDVFYCDMGCQKADAKRHRCGCIPREDPLCMKLFKVLLGP